MTKKAKQVKKVTKAKSSASSRVRAAARAAKALKVAKALKALAVEAALTSKHARFNAVVDGLRRLVTDMQLRPEATTQITDALDQLQVMDKVK